MREKGMPTMSTQSDAAETRWLRGGADGIARAMLLVPEAPLIGALLCAYWALSESPLIGLLVTLLIVNFIARTLALLGARIALAKAHHRAAAGLAQAALALYPWSA